MKKTTTIILLFLSMLVQAQVHSSQTSNSVWLAKEFSKEVALFRSKSFLYREVLGVETSINSFEIIPLAAATSGELTTLLYKSSTKNKEGIILGFFGDYWTDSGTGYQGYAFKNLDKTEAFEFLQKISDAIESHIKYMREDNDNNNIYFSYKDIDVLICSSSQSYTIRLFWSGFDSSWEKTAFERSKRRFEKKIK